MGQLIFIGLGLYDEKDISVKGEEKVKEADKVFTEFYTSNLAGADVKDLESELGVEIEVLSRDGVESDAVPVESAKDNTVVFLTAGDPMAATTHVDLRLRAEKEGISTEIIHSSSIFSAAPSLLGLQHYKFGKTITLPFRKERRYPDSPYENIKMNTDNGLHSLVLLDINDEEKEYMSVNEGVRALMSLEERLGEGVIEDDTLLVGLARVGSREPEVKADYPDELLKHDFGGGLHCIVIPGNLHFMEVDALKNFAEAPDEIGEC